MDYERKELLDGLAARFVLGTMQGGARRRFESLMRGSARVRGSTAQWSERLDVMASSLPPMQPSDRLWQRIDGRTRGEAERNARRPARWWQWLGSGAGFALGALVAVTLLRIAPSPLIDIERVAQQDERLPQSYAGILSDAVGKPAMLVSSTRHGTRAAIKVLAPIAVPPGSVLRLYALPAGGEPFALGDVPASGKGEIKLADSAEKLLSKVGELGVAVVPAGADASHRPERFLLRGPCAKFW